MKYSIEGEPLPVVICSVEAGETLICEGGAMSWMSPNMKMETSGGGVGKMLGRMFSGESLFQNRYTAMGGEGTIAEMLSERWQGIRPAVGYPSLPDTSLNFLLDHLLNLNQIGIRLTTSGAMKPHASVSGLMIAHPKARYFSVGKISDDQVADYARRRGVLVSLMRKFLGGNIQ